MADEACALRREIVQEAKDYIGAEFTSRSHSLGNDNAGALSTKNDERLAHRPSPRRTDCGRRNVSSVAVMLGGLQSAVYQLNSMSYRLRH